MTQIRSQSSDAQMFRRLAFSIPPIKSVIGQTFYSHFIKLILSAQLICFIKSALCANEINSNHFGFVSICSAPPDL